MASRENEEEPLPTLSEQVASQLGGVRGTLEATIPIVVFVGANSLWSLRPALLAALATAVAIGGFRLYRKQSVRHAANGMVGIAVGAAIAWRSGEATDVYLPGIWYTAGYCVALVGSVLFGRPLVGWLWSVIADNGATRWYQEEGLRRTFGWLTAVWASVYLVKLGLNLWVLNDAALSSDEKVNILGIMRIGLGAPPYALLLALTIWAVRRYQRNLTPPLPA